MPCLALAIVFALSSAASAGNFASSGCPGSPVENRRELVIIDAGVADSDAMALAVKPGIEVIQLSPRSDALAQIAAILSGQRKLSVVHLFSHGEPGALILGGRRVDERGLEQSGVLSTLNQTVGGDGELRLYGCQLAKGEKGARFYAAIAGAVKARVFASTDYSGGALLGGNWTLEAGDISRANAHPFREDFEYQGLLPPVYQRDDPNIAYYTRPGGSNSYWQYGSYTNAGLGVPSPTPITQVEFHTDTVALRGSIQWATSLAGPWTTISVPIGSVGPFTTVAGRIFRFVDSQPSDTTTTVNGGTNFLIQGNGSNFFTNAFFTPDNPPTDVFPLTLDFWGTPATGDPVSALRNTDTGAPFSFGGAYRIDSQSVSNLFSTNADTLTIGTGALPAVGQSATVTLHYYDYFQLDDSGVPVSGQGVSRTVTMTRRANPSGFSTELSANTFTTNAQNSPSVAGLSDGSYVVVWRSTGQDGEATSFTGIYGQKFTAAGVKSGAEFAISPAGNGISEASPSVAALANGRFVVAYQQTNTDNDIVFRIVEANGTLGAETQAPSTATGAQSAPWVAALSDGNFAITWIGPNGADTGDVWVRKFNSSNGSPVGGSEMVVNTTQAGTQSFPGVAGLTNGNYVVSWRDTGNSGDALCRIVNASGPVTSQIAVSTAANTTNTPRVAALTGGGFVIVYSETGRTEGSVVDTTSQSNIYARRYDNSGTLQGSEFLVNGGTTSSQTTPTVCGLSGGGFAVGWVSNTDYDGTTGVFGRRFDASAAPIEYDFQMSVRRVDTQSALVIAGLPSNSLAAAWADNTIDGTSDSGVVTRSLAGSVTAPTVTNVNPGSGSTTGGTGVTITGNNFTGATGVTFGGAAATSVVVVSDTSITCTTPAGLAGTASVIVTTPSGSNTANTLFTYVGPSATHFSVVAPATTIAGTAFSFTVNALDASNNVVSGYRGTVSFSSSDASPSVSLPSSYTFVAGDNGSHVFGSSATLVSVGTQTVTAKDTANSLTGVANITVNPAAASSFAVTAPATATAGTAVNITVTAKDPFGNTATSYSGTVHFTSSDGSASLPANSTLTAGAGTFSVTFNTTGNQTVTATDTVSGGLTSTSSAVSVSPAPVAISSLTKTGSSPTNAASVSWTLTFASAVTGLTSSNLSLTGAAAAGLSVGAPSTANGGLSWTIPVTTGSTDGALILNVANATGLSKPVSNTLPFAGDTITIDKTPPTVVSVTRLTPSAQTTNLSTVTFRVTYSEAVTGISAARYRILNVNGGTVTGTIGTPTGGPVIYDVPVTITGGAGEFRLRVRD